MRDEMDKRNDIQAEHNYCKWNHINDNAPEEAIYADDADFINISKARDTKITDIVGPLLRKDNLQVNDDKTEHTIITREKKRNQEQWRDVKKLGSLLGDDEDITNRKNQATNAYSKVER